MKDYIKEYRKLYTNGDIRLCEKSIRQLDRVEYMIDENIVNYSLTHAHHCINWIEKYCKHYVGKFAGKPFLLSPWQKYIISVVFGFLDPKTGYRITRDAFVLIARKNGKTTFAAAISLYLLIADQESAPEVYSIATKKEQAKILYEDSYKMVQYSSQLSSVIKRRRTDLECTFNDGKQSPLANDSNTLDGLNPHGAMFDELHAYVTQDIIDVIQSGIGARLQPLMFFITTNGHVRGKVFDNRYKYYEDVLYGRVEDWSIQPFFYELDDEDELSNPDMWEKCNPNINISLDEKYLKDQIKRAQDDPAQKIGVLTKNFNLPQTGQNSFLSAEECEINTFDEELLRGTNGVIGLDMSYKIDLTVVTYLTKIDDKFYVKQWFFKGKDLVDEHSRVDKVNYRSYDEVVLLNGSTIEQKEILDFIYEIVEKYELTILKFGIDPYRADYILNTLRDAYYKEYAVAVSNQYRKAITRTIYKMKDLLSTRSIKFNSPLTSLHLASCQVDVDKQDLLNIVKIQQNARIDGAISLLYALKAYELYMMDVGYKENEVWDGGEEYNDN